MTQTWKKKKWVQTVRRICLLYFRKPISQQNEEKSVASQNLMWSNTFKIFTDADSIVKKNTLIVLYNSTNTPSVTKLCRRQNELFWWSLGKHIHESGIIHKYLEKIRELSDTQKVPKFVLNVGWTMLEWFKKNNIYMYWKIYKVLFIRSWSSSRFFGWQKTWGRWNNIVVKIKLWLNVSRI